MRLNESCYPKLLQTKLTLPTLSCLVIIEIEAMGSDQATSKLASTWIIFFNPNFVYNISSKDGWYI